MFHHSTLSADFADIGSQPGSDHSRLRIVRAADRDIAFSEYGDMTGFPVLYCHQQGGSRLEARVLSHSAMRHGIRLIAADRPGLGGTGPAPDPAAAGRDLERLVEALALEHYGLLAWGGGTAHALMQASRDPDRVRFCMSLSCPPLWLDDSDGAVGRRAALTLMAKLTQWQCRLAVHCMTLPQRIAALERAVCGPDRRMLAEPAVRHWLESVLRASLRQGSGGFVRDLAESFRPWPLEPATLDLPVDFWYGSADRLVSETAGQWLAARLARPGKVRRIRGAGHFFMLRHQDLLFERLQVLAGRRGSGFRFSHDSDRVMLPTPDPVPAVA